MPYEAGTDAGREVSAWISLRIPVRVQRAVKE